MRVLWSLMAGTAFRLLDGMDSEAKGYSAIQKELESMMICIHECSEGFIDAFYSEPFAAFIDTVLVDAVQYVESVPCSSC